MKYKLKVNSILHPGQRKDSEGKPHQEDCMFPLHGEATGADRLFILCDGMGGHDAGEVASRTVCEAMSKSILMFVPDTEGTFSKTVFDKALSDAYDALDAKDENTSSRKMGTTMTLLKLYNDGYFIAHIGDSRVYHIRPGKTAEDTQILFRTEDHSLVNALVRIGEITEEEALHHPKKNVILRAMQPHAEQRAKADIHTGSDIRPGDCFYLCTDGMLENMTDRQLCYFFSREVSGDRRAELLLKATQENRDNHSAIIVRILNVEGAAEQPETSTETIPVSRCGGQQKTSETSAGDSRAIRRGGLAIVLICLLTAAVALCVCLPRKSAPEQQPVPTQQSSNIQPLAKP